MLRFTSWGSIAILLLAGCSGDDGGTSGDTDATTDSATDARDTGTVADAKTDALDGADAEDTSTSDAPADTPADSSSDGPVDAPTDGPADVPADGSLDAEVGSGTLTITGLAAFADCMPIVPPDPVHASWTASISGASGTTATLLEAQLTVGTLTQTLTLDHPDIALSGGAGSQAQTKVSGSPNPPAGCTGLCSSTGVASLDLAFTTADGVLTAHAEAAFTCAF